MRLDATTLTDKNKSAILNIQKRNKTRYQVKNKINSLLWRHLKLKTKNKKTSQRILFSLFPKTCSFSRTCSFPLLYILCTYNVKQKFHENAQHVVLPFHETFPAHFGPKVSRFAKSFMKVNSVNLGCWLKSNFVSITWVLHFILKRSYFHETSWNATGFSVCNKQKILPFHTTLTGFSYI
jgi:hypothetical protein